MLLGHVGPITSLLFFDANTLISASLDCTVRVWSVSEELKPECLAVVEVPGKFSNLCDVRLSWDRSVLATLSVQGSVMLLDTLTWTPTEFCSTALGSLKGTSAIAFSPTMLIASLKGGPFVGIDMLSFEFVRSLGPSLDGENSGTTRAMCVSPDGLSLATANAEKIRFYDLGSMRISQVFHGHEGDVLSLSFHGGNGGLLLSSSNDRTIRLWSLATGSARVFRCPDSPAKVATLAPDLASLAAWCRGGVMLWAFGSDALSESAPTVVDQPFASGLSVVEAVNELLSIQEREFSELRGYAKPPEGVKMVFEAVALILRLHKPGTDPVEATRVSLVRKELRGLMCGMRHFLPSTALQKRLLEFQLNGKFTVVHMRSLNGAAAIMLSWVLSVASALTRVAPIGDVPVRPRPLSPLVRGSLSPVVSLSGKDALTPGLALSLASRLQQGSVEELSLTGCGDVGALLGTVQGVVRLRSLELRWMASRTAVDNFLDLLDPLFLEELTIVGMPVASGWPSVLSRATNLKALTIADCPSRLQLERQQLEQSLPPPPSPPPPLPPLTPLPPLPSLEVLTVKRCPWALVALASLPEGLRRLFISDGPVDPASPPQFTRMETLSLPPCGLTSASLIERSASSLRELALSGNPIGTAGAKIVGAPGLQMVDVSRCSLPRAALSELSASGRHLKVLICAGNPDLGTLPPFEERGVNPLIYVDCTNCGLTTIGVALKRAEVKLTGNDLVCPPSEIAHLGWESCRRYLEELTHGAFANRRFKLFLTGLGEAGKTTLLKALMSPDNKAPIKIGKDDRTFGVDVTEWEPPREAGEGEPMKLIVSDFAGQRVYYPSHQFFMSGRGIYLLVVRPFLAERSAAVVLKAPDAVCFGCSVRLDDPLASSLSHRSVVFFVEGRGHVHSGCMNYGEMIGDWLRRIFFKAPGAHLMIVVTRATTMPAPVLAEQVDRLAEEVSSTLAQLRRSVEIGLENENPAAGSHRERLLKGLIVAPLRVANGGRPIAVDSMSGEGIAALRSSIIAAVKALPAWEEPVPLAYAELSKKIVALRSERASKGIFVPWERYQDLCKACGITSPERIEVATRFLHGVGTLLHYPDPHLRHIVFPDPQAAGDVFRAIVSHDPLHGRGRISHSVRQAIAALVRRGVLDHEGLMPFLLTGKDILPAEDLASPEKVGLIAELLRRFGIMFPDDIYEWRSGRKRSIIPYLAASRPAAVSLASPDQHVASGTTSAHKFQKILRFVLLPEGFIFRVIALHIRPRMTVEFTMNRALWTLHGRRITLVLDEDDEAGDVVVTLGACRQSDLTPLAEAVVAAEKFFEGLVRSSTTNVGNDDSGEDMDVAVICNLADDFDTIGRHLADNGLNAFHLEPTSDEVDYGEDSNVVTEANKAVAPLDLDPSVRCLIVVLDASCTSSDSALVRLLPGLRASGAADRLPVVVVADGTSYKPDFAARATDSRGEVIQRIWPAFNEQDSEKALWFADLMGGQILRDLHPGGDGPNYVSDVANSIDHVAHTGGPARLPPGHELALFPRSIPSPEFENLVLCAGTDDDRSFLRTWFEDDASAMLCHLRKVDELLPGFREGGRDLEWRAACTKLKSVLGRSALRALPGEGNRVRRSLYVTGFDVACPQCDLTSEAFLFSRDDVLTLWRSSLKTVSCGRGHVVGLERILRPDCFLSYSWGPWNKDPILAFPTQKLVQMVKEGIENSTATEEMPGMMCWFDLERMKGDSQRAMRDGVEQSGLVIIFLDLAYLRSAACLTELKAAREKGKFIVPIVLPGFDPSLPFQSVEPDTIPPEVRVRITKDAEFLNPSAAKDTEANVNHAFFVANLAGDQATRAEAIANHVVEIIIKRTCRETLISGVGFTHHTAMGSAAITASLALKVMKKNQKAREARPAGRESPQSSPTPTAITPTRVWRSWKKVDEALNGSIVLEDMVSIHKKATQMGLWGPDMVELRAKILSMVGNKTKS